MFGVLDVYTYTSLIVYLTFLQGHYRIKCTPLIKLYLILHVTAPIV